MPVVNSKKDLTLNYKSTGKTFKGLIFSPKLDSSVKELVLSFKNDPLQACTFLLAMLLEEITGKFALNFFPEERCSMSNLMCILSALKMFLDY